MDDFGPQVTIGRVISLESQTGGISSMLKLIEPNHHFKP